MGFLKVFAVFTYATQLGESGLQSSLFRHLRITSINSRKLFKRNVLHVHLMSRKRPKTAYQTNRK